MADSGGQTGDITIGTVLAGKYRVDKILGEGGMGVVVAATHLQIDEPVAVKFLHGHLSKDAELVARFQREAKAARKIRSEHVVRILDVGELENGAPFMVMEYLAGRDLDALIRAEGPRSVPDAVDYLLQACEALAEAHVQGMVHRDLKPANLFVSKHADETALVKVLDFGISKVTGKDGADLGVTKTHSGVLGSPLYMAPEQMRSLRDVDARTDIWALGAILHELLAGAPPFHATTLTELCATILQDPPQAVRAVRPDVPPGLEAAILHCLSKDPAGRYPDVAALAMDLHPFASLAGRASAERIFGVYRVAGIPRGSMPPSPLESARTMHTGPPAPVTGPSLPIAIITPRRGTPAVGLVTTGKAWSSAGATMAGPPPTAAPPKSNALVLALVALVAVLGTIVVVFVVVPRFTRAPAAATSGPSAASSTAAASGSAPSTPSTAAPPRPASSTPQLEASSAPSPAASDAVASPGAPKPRAPRGRPPAAPAPTANSAADCAVPYTFDTQGGKHWKQECL